MSGETADDVSSSSARRPRWSLALGLGLFAIAGSIWLSIRPPERPDSGLDFEPTAEQSLRIDQLRAQISKKNPMFRDTDAREKDNAKLFTYMAATSDDPLVIEAALSALQAAFSSRSEKKETPDADLDRVLLRYMRSPSPRFAELAFQAARIPVMTEDPPPELISSLATIVESDAPLERRYRALETLNLLRPSLRNETARSALERVLATSEPLLISLSLFALAESEPSLNRADQAEERARLGDRAVSLLKHPNPGVRGRALYFLTEVPGLVDTATLEGAALVALGDQDGYVRGQAIDTVARSTNATFIPSLVPLVRDLARARYDISGWTDLRGEPGILPHDIPGRRTVAEAALFAIRAIRGGAVAAGSLAPEPELKVSQGGPGQSDAAILESAKIVEAWVAQVPAFSLEAPAHHTQRSSNEPSPVPLSKK